MYTEWLIHYIKFNMSLFNNDEQFFSMKMADSGGSRSQSERLLRTACFDSSLTTGPTFWDLPFHRLFLDLAHLHLQPRSTRFLAVQIYGAIHLWRPHGGGRGLGSSGRMWTGGGGPAPCGRPHRKLKLESTDVILSSSHAKNRDVPVIHPVPGKCRISHYSVLPGPGKIMGPSNIFFYYLLP